MPRLGFPGNGRLLAALRCLVLCSLLGLGFCCQGGDWPQFRGPTHDGVSTEQINEQWTGSVTNPVWLVPVSNSLSGFAVSGGRAFTQINRNLNSVDEDVCVALSTATGAELWATVMEPANYPDGFVGYDDGPRTTPAFDNGSVFVLSSYLKLYRLNATNGAVIWQKDLLALYGGSVIRFQNAASPLIDNGLIYLNANCGTSTLMALRTSDGSVAWRSQDEAMTHSTPTLATIQGVRQLIFAVQSGLVSLDPQTGARLWHFNYPFTFNPRYSVATQPVVHQDMVFVSGCHCDSYGSVVRRITLTGTNWTTTQLWWTNNPAAPFMNPVAYQGFLYGQFGIQQYDNTNAQLKCIDMQTGQVRWSVNGFGRGGTLLVNNRLLVLTETGSLVLAAPNPNAYTELGRCLAIPGYSNGDINKCWTAPAVSDGWVYVRSTSFGAAYNFSLPNSSPAIAVGPASLNLGSLQAGGCTNGTFYVTNTGGGTLAGSVSGAAAPFSVVSGGSYSLTSNQWQTVVAQYCPTVPGTNNLNLTFSGGSGATRVVTGSAYAAPAIAVGPATLNLGSLQAGACTNGTFCVTNLGGGTLTGSVSGAAAPFSVVSGGGYSLTSNQWQAVVVQYCPTVPGSNNLNLTFTGGSGATRPVTGLAYPKPPLTLDPPSPSPGHRFQLTVRTVNGTPLDSNRLAAMEVRASTNLSLSASGWPKLTNNLLLTNGVARVLNVDGGPPRRYFIVREPQ